MTYGDPPVDPRWHRLLGLAVHEFRTPIGVVAGYIRMLLSGRVGELTEQQRRLLTEAEKSCGRLAGLVAEMSELSNLEAGTATFNRSNLELQPLLEETIASLPAMPDREVPVTLEGDAAALVSGDPTRLRSAFTSVIVALRRELVSDGGLKVRVRRGPFGGGSGVWIALADDANIEAVAGADESTLETFNEWRGGSGLSLAIARRIINAHDGRLWSPAGDIKTGAVIALPAAR